MADGTNFRKAGFLGNLPTSAGPFLNVAPPKRCATGVRRALKFEKRKGTETAGNASGYSLITGIRFDKHQNMILSD
jgi:hypothetical protein